MIEVFLCVLIGIEILLLLPTFASLLKETFDGFLVRTRFGKGRVIDRRIEYVEGSFRHLDRGNRIYIPEHERRVIIAEIDGLQVRIEHIERTLFDSIEIGHSIELEYKIGRWSKQIIVICTRTIR